MVQTTKPKGLKMANEQQLRTSEGQLKLHYAKIEKIALFNKDLAMRIEHFTNTLIENDFSGIFDVDDDVYHAGLGISQSRFSHLKVSPADYYYNTYENLDSVADRKSCYVEGDFIHRIVLEKGTVKDKFRDEFQLMDKILCLRPELKNVRACKEYKEERQNLRDQGIELIKEGLFKNAHMIEEMFNENEILKSITQNALKEKCIYSLCKETGLIRKSKVDILTEFPDYIYMSDLKSSISLDDDKIDRSCDDYGYNVQSAYYEDIVKDVTGKPVKKNLLIFVSKSAPFEIKIKFIDDTSMTVGQKRYKKHLNKLAECYASGEFPRNEITISACGIPAYRMTSALVEIGEE